MANSNIIYSYGILKDYVANKIISIEWTNFALYTIKIGHETVGIWTKIKHLWEKWLAR